MENQHNSLWEVEIITCQLKTSKRTKKCSGKKVLQWSKVCNWVWAYSSSREIGRTLTLNFHISKLQLPHYAQLLHFLNCTVKKKETKINDINLIRFSRFPSPENNGEIPKKRITTMSMLNNKLLTSQQLHVQS